MIKTEPRSSSVCARTATLLLSAVMAAGCAASQSDVPSTARGSAQARSSSAPPPGVKTVDAPVYKEGDVWVDSVRGQEREFRIQHKRDDGGFDVSFWGTQMTTDGRLNILIYRSLTSDGSSSSKSNIAIPWFAYPLYAGKQWDETFKWQTQDAMPVVGTSSVKGKAIRWEEVTVPAGTFTALRVEVSIRSFGRGGAVDFMTMTYWHVPDVRRFVKFDFHSQWEGTLQADLIAYKPAAGSR
ncbi:MAG: hypothetical protein ACREQB_04770 [Candidatus Binataceae bacterium]